MKITLITGHFRNEEHVLLNELARDMAAYGAEVTVLTGYPSRRVSEKMRQHYLNNPVEHISENVVVRRVGSRKGEGTGLLERMIKYVFLTRKLYQEAKKTPTDVYFLYSAPPFLGYIGCKLTKIAPTLYNAQDLFPDTLSNLKNMSDRNPLIAWFRRKEKQVYAQNTRIVTISQDMKKNIVGAGCDPEKVDVVYNWADTPNLHHVEKAENLLMDELGIQKDKFIVSYAGDIGFFQGWDVIIGAAKILQEKASDVQFVLIGNGSYKVQLMEKLETENLRNIQVFPLQPASRLPEIYSIGDMELVPIKKGITRMSFPSKTSVIMSCGSPILALVDADSEMAEIIEGHNMGMALEHGSAGKLAEAILHCYDHRSELAQWGQNARAFAEKNYSRKTQTKKYFDIIQKLHKRCD